MNRHILFMYFMVGRTMVINIQRHDVMDGSNTVDAYINGSVNQNQLIRVKYKC